MVPLIFFLKPNCLSLKNIFLYLYLHKLATALIWALIGCSSILRLDERITCTHAVHEDDRMATKGDSHLSKYFQRIKFFENIQL